MFEDLVNIYDDFTKNERTQSLSRFAIENDFGFTKREPYGEQVTHLRNFRVFKGKGVKRFIGIIAIPAREGMNAEIRFYDYLVTKDLETKCTSVIELYVPSHDFGSSIIKPKAAVSRMFTPTFSKAKSVRFKKRFSGDSSVEWTPRVMDLMLTRPKVTVEGCQDTILIYRKKKSIEVLDIFQLIEFAEEFVFLMNSVDSGDFV